MKARLSSPPVRVSSRFGFLWLGLGTLCALFASNGRWDISLAAWFAPLLLLRFTRTSRPFLGFVWVWLVSIVTMLFFLYQSQILGDLKVVLVCLLFATLLTLPYLFDRLVASRLSLVSGVLATLLFPLSRAALEYLLSFGPLGGIFSLTYTQYGNLPLLQLISVTGIYGVSFLIAWFASVGNWVWEQHLVWPRIRTITLLYSGLLALVFLGGSIRLTFFAPAGPTVRVAGVGVPLSMLQHAQQEFSLATETHNLALLRSAAAPINNELLDLSRIEAQAGAKIIVWREGGADVLAADEANLIQRSETLARQQGIYIDMGVSVVQPPATFYDQSILVDPQGHADWIYNKTHPAPGDPQGPGDGIVPVANTPYGNLATVICFDADFPDLGRQAANKGADVLLVPANDWQGIDPWHAQHATFRAIEDGFSLVRQNGDGLEMTVDYQGHVLAATDPSATGGQQMTIAYVPVQGVWTIYAHIGDVFAWLCLAGSLLLLGWGTVLAFQQRSGSSTPVVESVSPASVAGVDGNEATTSVGI